MSSLRSVILPLFAVILAGGCSSSDSPSETAVSLMEALSNADLAKAKESFDPSQHGLVEMGFNMSASIQEGGTSADHKGPFIVVSEKITGDQAIVIIKQADDSEEEVTLHKVDGEWKVYHDK